MNDILLRATSINLSFNQRQILKDISFAVRKGNIVTLIGPNGSGKTSLARIALGLLIPTSGKVMMAADIAVGYVPQKITIDPSLPLTVERFLHLQSTNKNAIKQIINEIGITHLLPSQVQSISGGEMQRVMLARALLPIPQLLVLDEPVQGVDIQGQAEFYQLIEHIRSHYGTGILMISHDLHMVMKTTDHVICINHHICCEGSPEDVSKHPAYAELFGITTMKSIGVYTHHHDHKHDMHGDVVDRQE